MLYVQVSFYARVTFLKKFAQIEHRIPFKTVYILGVRGLTSSCVVCNYTTSGHAVL